MKRLVDLQTDAEFAELSQILERVRHGDLVATLKQVVKKPNGEYGYIDLQKQAVNGINTILQSNDKWFYVTVQNVNDVNVRRLQSMWQTVLQRGTQQNKSGAANDYLMVLDVVRTDIKDGADEGFIYGITALQPVFGHADGRSNLMFCFEMGDVSCSKEAFNTAEIEFEISEREASGDVPYIDDEDFEENDRMNDGASEYTGESFVNTDKYTKV